MHGSWGVPVLSIGFGVSYGHTPRGWFSSMRLSYGGKKRKGLNNLLVLIIVFMWIALVGAAVLLCFGEKPGSCPFRIILGTIIVSIVVNRNGLCCSHDLVSNKRENNKKIIIENRN
ncbi:hypothetical protein PanWU01x14_038700 [Parasponia andersonii]|uniref:Transmembrane protein n=1 Tax=Parasponia andersonii TaxID=3476 RepID=A0A2P5DRM1_PARAD|nr:hypothetical protein PanWU01x14_038700 [Parasponia andersonii]